MTAEILHFNGITRHDIPAERVLQSALESEVDKVVIIGYDKDGEEFMASSIADGGTVLWLMERLKKKLLEMAD